MNKHSERKAVLWSLRDQVALGIPSPSQTVSKRMRAGLGLEKLQASELPRHKEEFQVQKGR